MDWSLYRCGRVGHITYAPDEPHLREHIRAQTAVAELWRCLRCGTYVTGAAHASGPAAGAPAVKRGKQIRGDLILKLFAIERAIRVVIFGALAFGIWRYASSHSIAQAIKKDIPIVRTFAKQLGFTLNHALLDKIQSLLHVSASNLRLLAAGVSALAIVSAIEAFALWQAKRWGEYFAMIVTSLGLPFEVYELSKSVTVTKGILFALNILLVAYLVYSRRLFGARGGKEAYEARLRAESVLDEAERAAAALRATVSQDGTCAAAASSAGAPPPGRGAGGGAGPMAAGPEGRAAQAAAAPSAGRPAQGSEPATTRHDTTGPA
jgi:uncharacterized membrane protein (DUF2068 family)